VHVPAPSLQPQSDLALRITRRPENDDQLWGLFMAGRGIGLYRPDGWSAYPIDVAAGVHPCGLLLEPIRCDKAVFTIGVGTGACVCVCVRVCVCVCVCVSVCYTSLCSSAPAKPPHCTRPLLPPARFKPYPGPGA
jgi:hypothetical protein